MKEFDPITLETMWNRLVSIAEECYLNIWRTSFSFIVTEALDFGADLLDSRGRLLAHPPQSMPGFHYCLANCARAVLEEYPAHTLVPGDVLICNDPWTAAGHLFDIGVFTPVFGPRGDVVSFVAGMANVTDIGGTRYRHQVREIYDEGFFMPPLKLYKAGVPNRDLFRLLENNVRLADQVLGDVHAMVAANATGAEQIRAFMAAYELEELDSLAETIHTRSEEAMRAAIRALPEGTYRAVQPCDGVDHPLEIPIAIHVRDGEAHVDFAGCPPQVAHGGINCTLSITTGVIAADFHSLLCPDVPANDGIFRPVRVTAPEGSLLNCTRPASVNLRSRVLWNLNPAVHLALGPALGDRNQAPTGYPTSIKSYGVDQAGRFFSDHLFQGGGQGGSARGDGLNALIYPTSAGNVSIELFEQRSPVLVDCKEFIPDSGGPGYHRGGLGQRIQVRRLPDKSGRLTMIAMWPEALGFVNPGMEGGASGGPTRILRKSGPDDPDESFKTGVAWEVRDDAARITLIMPGGAGWGPPLKREESRVARDLADGYITPEGAQRDYGRKQRGDGR